MAVISITGTSGVGKSFLVTQMSALGMLPAIHEGEEGVLPDHILEEVFTKENPIPRYEYFINKDITLLKRARKVSETGFDCILDASAYAPRAIMADEPEEHHDTIKEMMSPLRELAEDKTVLLTAKEEKLRELIDTRGRKTEEVDVAVRRALKIQDAFLELAEANGFVVIDRTNLEFTNSKDLEKIRNIIFG